MASKTLSYVLSTFILLVQLHYSAGQSVVKSAYWTPRDYFPASNIDSTLFTHLFCAFADLDPSTYLVTISSSNSAQFSTFTQTVQRKNPSVKTLLSIGGGDSSTSSFASMASQPSTRKSFIDSSINLARSNNFHGLDLDWEYPSTAAEYTNLGTLLNEWRAAVVAESRSSGKPPLLLTAAVFYSSDYYSLIYPIQAISNSLDWLNIMAYDLITPDASNSPTRTGPPAALYNPTSQVSGDAGIRAWIQSGVAAKKLVLGLPFYGRGWRLVNANNNGIFAPANGPASDGFGYAGIKDFIAANRATTVYNSSFVTDYCYAGTTWIGYDDTVSISTKVTYAKGKGLLGYFGWHVGADQNHYLSQTGTFARMGKFACYVVIRGRRPGVYSTWEECKAQVNFYHDALYWGYHSEEEAIEALTTTCRVKTPPIRDTETILGMLKRPNIVAESPCSSVSFPSPSPSVASIDEWKFEKRLVGILLIALIALVVVVISVVVKLYLL